MKIYEKVKRIISYWKANKYNYLDRINGLYFFPY